jgi:hypothetical protein
MPQLGQRVAVKSRYHKNCVCVCVCVLLRIKTRASHILPKCSTSEISSSAHAQKCFEMLKNK